MCSSKPNISRRAAGLIGAAAGIALVALATLPASADDQNASSGHVHWSDAELNVLRSLWIGSLPPLPPDPSNKVGDDAQAASLGQHIFFDTRFSADNQVACATCHIPAVAFTDGRKLGRGVGTAGRNTMTLLGAAYSPWFFWDGRKDSQWSQALGPMESAVEHRGTRTQFAHVLASDSTYRSAYAGLFGELPDLTDHNRFPPSAGPVEDPETRAAWQAMAPQDQASINRIFSNIGKVIAAYQRRLLPGPSRFDRYVEAVLTDNTAAAPELLTASELNGLQLFIGRGQCIRCHNGPLFTNNDFHNTGVPTLPNKGADMGRSAGVTSVFADEFNCLGEYSDATPRDCGELRFAKAEGPELVGAMKTPTLRSVSQTGPYFHAGQFATLDAVLDHYNRAPKAKIGNSELNALGLTQSELKDLKAFLLTLDSPPKVERVYLTPPS